MRWHRLSRAHRHLRAARSDRQHPRTDPRPPSDIRNQESRARRGHALPARVRRRAGAEGDHDTSRNQQGDVRRMSAALPRWLSNRPPAAAVEINPRRVTAAVISQQGGTRVLSSYAGEPLPAGAVDASLNAINVHDAAALTAAIRSVLDRLSSRPRRIALVLPDTVGKLSLVRFEKIPAKAQDLDQLIRWQVRKAAPFKIEDAQVSWIPGIV